MTTSTTSLRELPLTTIDGLATSLGDLGDGPTLVVNVASQCGLTPQYTGLERIADRYAARGLTVLGVPCNQFGEQEPGSAEEISAFCSNTYGVTFPLLEKVDVNGPDRHPLFERLSSVVGVDGYAGDVRWNFEKWVVGRDGTVLARFKPKTDPESPEVLAALETALGSPQSDDS